MSTTTQLPPGIYHINVAFAVEPARLTREEGRRITILPPSVERDPEQEWQIIHGKDGSILIERPSRIRPASYLTYEGAPKKPEQGDKIIFHVSEFPPNEWHLQIAPGFTSLIRVAGSDLGIRIAPLKIYPPILELGGDHQIQWVFERVGDE